MKIDKLSDEQKTVMLARLCRWAIKSDGSRTWVTCQDEPFSTTNLYQPIFMLLAWRVLNWAAANGITTEINVVYQYKKGDWARMIDISPADAQRAWLDYILRKAIEAGMVADDE